MQSLSEQPTLLVRGHWLFPGGSQPEIAIRDGALAIHNEKILEVGAWPDLRQRYPSVKVLGSDRHALLPGLINAHHHSQGASHIQHGISDQLLESWLLDLARRRGANPLLVTQLAAARLLHTGVTSVVDVHSGHGSSEVFANDLDRRLKAYEMAGIRVALATGVSRQSFLIWGDDQAFLDSLPEDVQTLACRRLPGPDALTEDDYFDVFDQFWQRYANHPRIDLWFAPPGPQWVSDDFLLRIVDAAEHYDTGVQTHLEESIYEKHYGPRVYGVPTIMHLQQLGLLSPRFSCAHGVWLTAPEIEILARSGAAVSHNPSSNLRLRAGIAPLNAMLAAEVTVALGMDGTTINDNEDMWQEMRLALRLHRSPRLDRPAPTYADIFRLATHGGASLLRAADQRGALAAGYQADVVLLDLDRITWPWVAPEADPLGLILYRAAAGDVDTVLIGGEVVVEKGQVKTVDEAAVAQELAASLAGTDYPAEDATMVEALLPHVEKFYQEWELQILEPYLVYNSRT
jgi:cytosine/adenosine deaminase-related metal-dependent hydrolase